MYKPSISKILIFIFVKYLFFYIFMMFNNNNYALISINELDSFEDVFYYLIIFMSLPVVFSIFLSVPLYNSFRIKKFVYFILAISMIFIVEYLIYTYLASQANYFNGLYNGIISLMIFGFFFYKSVIKIAKNENIDNVPN